MTVLRTTTRLLAASSLLAGAVLVTTTAPPAAAATPSPTSALSWLADDLAETDYLFGQVLDFGEGPAFFPDYGLTVDAVMAFALYGAEADAADEAMAVIEDNILDAVTGVGYGEPDDRFSGALGKVLLGAELHGDDTDDFGGLDLEAEVRARMRTTGVQAGRFSDASAFGSDFSNGFGQVLNIAALSHTVGGVPQAAIDFLVAQQCPGGGFRGVYGTTAGCTSDADADADYTAFAVQALLTSPTVPGVTDAIDEAIDWLLELQADDGSLLNQDGSPNATTSGLAAQVFRAVGETEAAELSAAFVASLQLASGDDAGAIAFTAAGHDDAVEEGIDDATLDQFRRATTQSVLAFGATTYGVERDPAVPLPLTTALEWLADELADNGDLLGSSFDLGEGPVFFPDYGLTLDAVLALALGKVAPDQLAATVAVLEDDISHFVTDEEFGTGDGRTAGALGKALLTVAVVGADVNDFDDLDLEAEVRERMQTTGEQAGRFSDTGELDSSNGFAQALSVLGLSYTEDGVPEEAVAFLLDQQCPSGGFRGSYPDTLGCTDDEDADPDYTAVALSALLTVPTYDGVGPAINDAIESLHDLQSGDGGLPNVAGDPNSNTTGLAASALRAAGEVDMADEAADYIASLQLTGDVVGTGPAAAEIGAIAFVEDARDATVEAGMQDFERDQYRRATAQAALAFGLPPYGVVPPATLTSTATEARPGDEITLAATGFRANELVSFVLQSDPVILGIQFAAATGAASLTFELPEVEPGAHTLSIVGLRTGFSATVPLTVLAPPPGETTTTTTVGGATTTTSTVGGTTPTTAGGGGGGTRLPITGSNALDLLFAGVLLVGLGLVSRGARARRSA